VTATETLIGTFTLPAATNTSTVTLLNTSTISELTQYRFSIAATAYGDDYGNKSPAFSGTYTTAAVTPGHFVYSGFVGSTSSWIVPPLVTSISAVAIGYGGDGGYGGGGDCPTHEPYSGGGGGGLSYKNNIAVTPGEILTLYVGSTYYGVGSYINRGGTRLLHATGGANGVSYLTSAAGGLGGTALGYDGGGNGGAGSNLISTALDDPGGSGGGAGGYSGNGGDAGSDFGSSGSDGLGGGGGGGYRYSTTSFGGNGGGGVGIYGSGTSGAGGTVSTNAGSGGSGGSAGTGTSLGGGGGQYGGGGGGATGGGGLALGGPAVIRILWGPGRAFPSTNVATSSS